MSNLTDLIEHMQALSVINFIQIILEGEDRARTVIDKEGNEIHL